MKRPGYGNLLGSRDTHSTKPQKVDSGTTHLFSRLLFCRRRHAAQLDQMAKIRQWCPRERFLGKTLWSCWGVFSGNGKIVFSSKIVFLSTGKIVFSKWEALADCLLCKWSTGWLSSLKTVIFTINWALYNCLLSTGELSSLKMRQWTIVFSKK